MILLPVLETKDKPRISYSEIKEYSKVHPQVMFWHFSNTFYNNDDNDVYFTLATSDSRIGKYKTENN